MLGKKGHQFNTGTGTQWGCEIFIPGHIQILTRQGPEQTTFSRGANQVISRSAFQHALLQESTALSGESVCSGHAGKHKHTDWLFHPSPSQFSNTLPRPLVWTLLQKQPCHSERLQSLSELFLQGCHDDGHKFAIIIMGLTVTPFPTEVSYGFV